MAANPQYAEGEVIANKYVVEGLAGESPAARTFIANGNAGKLCIKIYRQEISAKLLAAPDFFLKAGVMTEVDHDNLCGCIDVQEEMGMVFVARAFAEGMSFEEWVRKNRGEGNYYARGMELLWQSCQGLTLLHERTRHLNIHPGNVMVGPLVAKLCDWDPRALGNTEMTPDPLPLRPEYQGYRAPEAAGRGGFLSYPSTDLFAIAGLLYRLVKGEHPSSNPAQTLNEARSMDRDVAAFLAKAMHPKPEERFQEAGAFADGLWELQGAMKRLQEKAPRGGTVARAPEPVAPPPPRQADPFQATPAKEPTLFGAEAKPAQDDDSFFNFFPAADAAPAPKPAVKAPSFHEPEQYETPKPGGDTLFGAPPVRPTGYQAPKPEPVRREPTPPPPPRSALSELEDSGTVFGAQAPLFSSPKATPRAEPPPVAKSMPVSLSSLEKDPMEMAGSGSEPAGFTAYGFQGAGDNRTGIYNPDGKAAAAKAKLRILLISAGVLVLLLGMVGLFIFLRGNAAEKARPGGTTEAPVADAPIAADPGPAPEPVAPPAVESHPATTPAPAGQPYPDVAAPEAPTTPAPQVVAHATPAPKEETGYSEPPMPVEPPRPGSPPETPAANPAATAKTPKAAYQGNAHVTPEREASLMAMVQTRTWPNSAAERLKAADDLNDLGKTAEANLAYSKAVAASGGSEKQKIAALGGMAVTFQSMGMRDQAVDAVNKILAINPKNGFALKLRDKLK